MPPDFYGLATRTLENGLLRLEYLAAAGPRLVRLFLGDSQENLLAEVPGLGWETPFGRYVLYGGHRLWHAPEATPRSCIPDNDGLQVEELPDGVRLCRPAEPATGIRKCLEVRLLPGEMALTLHHELRNDGLWPVELAPWAITQLPPGGVAILPQTQAPVDGKGLLPNRNLILWPYTRWEDPRLRLFDDLIWIEGRSGPSPLKIGCLSARGWAAYFRHGLLFCKRFVPQLQRSHPDWNCNVEVYVERAFVELETLGPLERLEPGQCAWHTERWEFYRGPDVATDPDDLRDWIASLGLP